MEPLHGAEVALERCLYLHRCFTSALGKEESQKKMERGMDHSMKPWLILFARAFVTSDVADKRWHWVDGVENRDTDDHAEVIRCFHFGYCKVWSGHDIVTVGRTLNFP
jgi:hypothetical protein